MAENNGYADQKEFTCVCCGCKVMLTKFASAKTAKCPKCKADKVPINSDIVAQVTAEKAGSNHSADTTTSDDTKVCKCIKCGKDVVVTKFASASKVLCDECKGISHTDDGSIELKQLKIDMSKVDKATVPTLEDYHALPSLIANPRLRTAQCPACHTEMRILRVMDWSEFGLIISYQCPNCNLLVNVSEQCNMQIKMHSMGTIYDYSGKAIENLMNSVDSTRLSTTIHRLIELLDDHNIPIDGIELPPYRFEEERPVPVGFEIPSVDRWCKTIEDAISMLDNAARIGDEVDDSEGTRHIQISNTLASKMAESLKQLFKEDKNGDQNEVSNSD